jgi:hypothetical protein
MNNFPITADGQALTATAVSAPQPFAGAAERAAAAQDVLIYNPGPLAIHVRAGAADVVATTASMLVPPNSLQAFAKGSATHIAALSESGSQPYTVWIGEGTFSTSYAGPRGDIVDVAADRKAQFTYESAPAGYNQQQKAITTVNHAGYQHVGALSTAVGATTNAAGYAIGATVITLAVAGTGTLVAGERVQFAGDSNYYTLAAGDADVSNGGTITLAAPGLLTVLSAATKAITVVGQNETPVLGATGGAIGDYLESLTITVGMTGMAAVSICDSAAGKMMQVLPASMPIGTYDRPLNMASKAGGWKVTTTAGLTVIAHGRFS